MLSADRRSTPHAANPTPSLRGANLCAQMATRIISVLNQKGGVGKTTTCVNLGAALARRGQEVLLVDMDPQANLTVHVGVDPRTVERSTYSLLLGKHSIGDAVV